MQPIALLLIDVQQGFREETYWGGDRNNRQAENNIQKLITHWRARQWPVIHVKHNSTTAASPLHPTHAGNNLMEFAQLEGQEPLFQKQVNSAFIGTSLQAYLDAQQITRLLLVGFITDHCVSTTARMAGNLGYDVYVAEDATATFDRVGYDGQKVKAEDIHRFALISLHQEFATITTTETILQQLTSISYASL